MKNFKIHTFLVISLIFFLFFSYSFWWENAKIFLDFSGKHPFLQYNSALQFAQNTDYEKAFEVLPEDLENYNDRLFELRGDILYAKNFEKEIIIEAYKKSLEFSLNPRVQAKIDFLEWEKKSENESEKSENKKTKNSEEIQKKEEQLQQDQKNRQQFLNAYKSNSDDLEHFKNIFSAESMTEKQDW